MMRDVLVVTRGNCVAPVWLAVVATGSYLIIHLLQLNHVLKVNIACIV